MKKYLQLSEKINCSNDEEFIKKINDLHACADMPMEVKSTIPDITDLKRWYMVNYWIKVL